MLIRYFIHGLETEDQLRTLSSTAVDMMFVAIKPLGELLTTLPVGPKYPGKTAGASFEIYRTGYVLPHRRAAWIILRERLLELAAFCGKIVHTAVGPKGIADNSREFAEACVKPRDPCQHKSSLKHLQVTAPSQKQYL
jgi:hypothetical protein